jgi:hypothetical protein
MNNFKSLTLKQTDSKLNNISCYESININKLDKLIHSSILKKVFTNEITNKYFENEKNYLLAYKENYNNGLVKVDYIKSKTINFGRVNPIKALGLHNINRQIRHTIANEFYVDVDIKNCHPVIIEQILRSNNIETFYLSEYISNRDEQLAKVIHNHKCSRDQAKTLYIRMMYGGDYSYWIKDNNLTGSQLKSVLLFKKEFEQFQVILKNNNPELEQKILSIKQTNINGSLSSYYLQEKESIILETLYLYAKENKYIINDNVVLCADGMMIEKKLFNEKLLNEFTELIKNKFDIDLTFEIKQMNENYSDDIINNSLTFDDIQPINKEIEELKNNNINESIKNVISKLEVKRDKLINNNLLKFNKDFNKIMKKKNEKNKKIEDYKKEIIDDGFIPDEKYSLIFNREYINDLSCYQHKKIYFELFVCKILRPNVCYVYIESNFHNNRTQVLYKQKEISECFCEIKSGNYNEFGKPIPFILEWLNDEKLRCYNTIDFIPYNIKPIDNKILFNLFDGFNDKIHTIIDTDNINKKIKPFLDLGLELCGGNQIHFDYLLKFFAHLIKYPDEKMPICIIIKGVQGTGKNVFLDAIGNLIGSDYYITSSNPSDFFGDYAEGFYRKLLVNMNECEQKDTFDFEGKIKSFITEDTITLNAKFLRQTKIRNVARVIITTNKPNPIPIDTKSKDRRYVIYKTTEKYLEKKYNTNFWLTLIKHFKSSDFIASLYYFFNNMDIENYDWRLNRPITEAYKEMLKLNYPVETLFIQDYITGNRIRFQNDNNVIFDKDNTIIGETIKAKSLYNCYIDYSKDNGFINDKSFVTNISKFINRLTELKLPLQIHNTGGVKNFRFYYKEILDYMKNNNLIEKDDNDCLFDEEQKQDTVIMDEEFQDYFN